MKTETFFLKSLLFITYLLVASQIAKCQWTKSINYDYQSLGTVPDVSWVEACDQYVAINGLLGLHYQFSNQETWNFAQNQIAFGVTPSAIYRTYNYQVLKSYNFGNTWIEANDGVPDMILSSDYRCYNSKMYSNFYFSGGSGLFVDQNDNGVWSNLTENLDIALINDYFVNGDTIILCTNEGIFSPLPWKCYLSVNYGASWEQLNFDNYTESAFPSHAIIKNSKIIVCDYINSKMITSQDFGNTWDVTLNNHQSSSMKFADGLIFTFNRAYSSESALFMSDNFGTSWQSIPLTYIDNSSQLQNIVYGAGGNIEVTAERIYLVLNDEVFYMNLNDFLLSIENHTTVNCLVFPNPSTDILNITSSKSYEYVKIYDMNGRLVYYTNHSIPITQESLNLSKLKNGVYNLELQSKDFIINKKFFKQ